MFHFTCPPMPHYVIGGEDTYAVGRKHPDRSNIGYFDLLIVTGGCLYMGEEERSFRVPTHHYAILRPDLSHRTTAPCDEETHFYWLHFQTSGSWVDMNDLEAATPALSPNIDSFSFYLPRFGKLQNPSSFYDMMRQLLQIHRPSMAMHRWKQQQLFLDLLPHLQEGSSISGPSSHQYRIAEDAAAFLRQRYREPLDYKRLSDELHFHANYIALCMKKTIGCTPLEYLTRHRVEQAKRKLILTDDPIGQIAEETGFGSFPYFVRCFGKHTGFKPKAFRMLYRSPPK